jgi:hypothetical protein
VPRSSAVAFSVAIAWSAVSVGAACRRSDEVGLVDDRTGREALAVHGGPGDRALRREGSEIAVLVDGADGDALGVARGAADGSGAAGVAGREHRDDPECAPCLHHRKEPGIGAGRGDPGVGDDGRVVGSRGVPVRIHHPLGCGDQRAAVTDALGVERLGDHEGGAGSDTDGSAASRSSDERARDVRPVGAIVVRGRSAVHEIVPCGDLAGEVGVRGVDARVDHADALALARDAVCIPDRAGADRVDAPVAGARRLLRHDLGVGVGGVHCRVEVDGRNVRIAGDPCDLRRAGAEGDGIDEPEVRDALRSDERNILARAARLAMEGGDQSGGVTRVARGVDLVSQGDENGHALRDTRGGKARLQRGCHVGIRDRRNEAHCKRACGC